MFRDQVYNGGGWEADTRSGGGASETQRRLHRRINHNIGLNNSRNSNHSNSFRMRRTELSGEKYNSRDRDRDQTAHQISGLLSQDINDSHRQQPKKIGSLLSLSRRRLAPDPRSPNAHQQPRSSKNIVENLYMLTTNANNQHQPDRRQRHVRLDQTSPRQQPRPQQERRREESGAERQVTPTRGSLLRNRNSRDKSRVRGDKSDSSRGRYRQGNEQRPRGEAEREIRKLEEKYLENVYQLNSPKGKHPLQKRRSDRNNNYQNSPNDRHQYGQSPNQRHQFVQSPKERHQFVQHPHERHQFVQSPNERQFAANNYHPQNQPSNHNYPQTFSGGSQSNNFSNPSIPPSVSSTSSQRNINHYYFQQGQPSTGIKTLPEVSKVDTAPLSDASLPVHSINSHHSARPAPTPNPHSQRPPVKLDRKTKKDPRKKQREQRQEREKEREQQLSSLSQRWRINNIQLEERREEELGVRERVIGEEEGEVVVGSVFLPVQSRREEGREWAEDILERIILHLESLNLIADYTKEFRHMYENVEPWETLIFLSYKKFYIERTKVTSILRSNARLEPEDFQEKLETVDNPFILPYSKVSSQELSRFRDTKECMALRYELESENTRIRNALRGLYNLYIEKSGEHVNMLDCDNFSEEIFRLMLEELEGIAENLEEAGLVVATKTRMGKIIKAGLLIAYLNGKYVKNFAQVLLHEDMIKIGKRETLREDCIADLFLQEFRRVLT